MFIIPYSMFDIPLIFSWSVISIYSIEKMVVTLNDVGHYPFYPSEIIHTGKKQYQCDDGAVQ